MKKIALVAVCIALWAVPAHAAESIPSFMTVVEIRADSSLRITETVVYDMDTVERHGLERIIPRQSENGPRIVIRDVDATRDGVNDPVSVNEAEGSFVIRIGDPDITMSGTHTYVLSYTVFNEVRYFDDRDEVYWNAIPQEMRLPITRAEAVVTIPFGATLVGNPFCYTGARGMQDADCLLDVTENSISAVATRPFGVNEGMTVAVAIAPGVITRAAPVSSYTKPWPGILIMPFLAVAGVIFVAVVVGFIIYSSRMIGLPKKRRDGGDIVAQYDPPAGCSAPEASYLAARTNQGRIFTAAVVQLAVEGWLTMRFSHQKKWYGKQTEILFIRAREGHPEDPTLHQVMDSLFIIGRERTLTELRRDAKLGAAPILSIAAGVPLILERRGWFEKHGWFGALTRMSEAGESVREHLAGLKLYIGAAEKERLAFHNAPEHSPETFEKLLPYAIALGVDEPWIRAFGDLQSIPKWTDGDFSAVGMVALSESLGELSSGAQSVMNAYSSGTGGGGGGGGGGSSGGGGGGGGGGGW